MTYKVLSLKWRPQVFSDIVGQEHVTKTLVNAFKKDRVAQGYIFTGPRGVGKTTTARILSKALNADGGPCYDFDPSSKLAEEISQGRALDVLEIDGASNRGIEEIRNLREQIKFSPMVGQYKVIIIDEVHMLTNPAFNALLRTLEEPPEHGKFIFCTTDIHKVPATIISRCQRFDFNRIATDVIIDRITFILKNEKIKSDQDSLQIISRKADGSMRDALSILDQVISYCGTDISYDKTVSALGVIPNDLYFEYTESLIIKDGTLLLNVLERFSRYGVPAAEVVNGINNHIKNLFKDVKQYEPLIALKGGENGLTSFKNLLELDEKAGFDVEAVRTEYYDAIVENVVEQMKAINPTDNTSEIQKYQTEADRDLMSITDVIANSQAYQQLIGGAGFQSLIQQNPEFGESIIASIMKGLGLETKDYSEQLSALSDTIGAFTDTITLPSVVENKLLTWGNEKTQSIEAQNLAFKQGLETILGREATQGLLWSIKESKPESITALAQIFNMSSVDFSKMVNKTLGNK